MYLHKCPGTILLKLFVCVCMAQVFIPMTAACIEYFTTYNGVVNIHCSSSTCAGDYSIFVVLQLVGEYSEVIGLVVQKFSELQLFLQSMQFL